MTTGIYLDPDQVAGLEPSEGNTGHTVMLSPFAVPRIITPVVSVTGELLKLSFEYEGGEPADTTEPLDGRSDPSVILVLGNRSRKVVELRFIPPLARSQPNGAEQLSAIAQRLTDRAHFETHRQSRMSILLVSKVIQNWAKLIVEDIKDKIARR